MRVEEAVRSPRTARHHLDDASRSTQGAEVGDTLALSLTVARYTSQALCGASSLTRSFGTNQAIIGDDTVEIDHRGGGGVSDCLVRHRPDSGDLGPMFVRPVGFSVVSRQASLTGRFGSAPPQFAQYRGPKTIVLPTPGGTFCWCRHPPPPYRDDPARVAITQSPNVGHANSDRA